MNRTLVVMIDAKQPFALGAMSKDVAYSTGTRSVMATAQGPLILPELGTCREGQLL